MSDREIHHNTIILPLKSAMTYHRLINRRCYLVALVLVLVVVLACGPADLSVQERIGNVDAQPQDEEPTPMPAPTTCISGLDDKGESYETCWTPPTPRPTKYPELPEDLDYRVQDATSGASGAAAAERIEVLAWIAEEATDEARSQAIQWLDDEGILYDDHDNAFQVVLRIDQLPGLVALEAITYVSVPTPAVTPREIDPSEVNPSP